MLVLLSAAALATTVDCPLDGLPTGRVRVADGGVALFAGETVVREVDVPEATGDLHVSCTGSAVILVSAESPGRFDRIELNFAEVVAALPEGMRTVSYAGVWRVRVDAGARATSGALLVADDGAARFWLDSEAAEAPVTSTRVVDGVLRVGIDGGEVAFRRRGDGLVGHAKWPTAIQLPATGERVDTTAEGDWARVVVAAGTYGGTALVVTEGSDALVRWNADAVVPLGSVYPALEGLALPLLVADGRVKRLDLPAGKLVRSLKRDRERRKLTLGELGPDLAREAVRAVTGDAPDRVVSDAVDVQIAEEMAASAVAEAVSRAVALGVAVPEASADGQIVVSGGRVTVWLRSTDPPAEPTQGWFAALVRAHGSP